MPGRKCSPERRPEVAAAHQCRDKYLPPTDISGHVEPWRSIRMTPDVSVPP